MPKVSQKYRRKLNEIGILLAAIGFAEKKNTDLTAWSILALQDDSPKQTKAGFNSLVKGASIRDILDFCRSCGTNYAENTRESLRKLSIKYLVDAGIVIRNHDNPGRPTNSAKTNYILDTTFLRILSAKDKTKLITAWKRKHPSDAVNDNWRKDKSLKISFGQFSYGVHPSPHNFLSKAAVETFLPVIAKDFEMLYFSDTDNKSLHVSDSLKRFLKAGFDIHKHMPDVVAYSKKSNSIFFIESVASAGEINDLRKKELDKLFPIQANTKRHYVSVFMDRKTFRKFSDTVANGTEVWILNKVPHTAAFRLLST